MRLIHAIILCLHLPASVNPTIEIISTVLLNETFSTRCIALIPYREHASTARNIIECRINGEKYSKHLVHDDVDDEKWLISRRWMILCRIISLDIARVLTLNSGRDTYIKRY